MRRAFRSAWLPALAILLAAGTAAACPSAELARALYAKPQTYGLYLQTMKVGDVTMRLSEEPGKLTLETRSRFAFQAMGQAQAMASRETHTFDADTCALLAVSYRNEAGGQSEVLEGRVSGGELYVVRMVGGQRYELHVPVADESLDDQLLLERAVKEGKAAAGAVFVQKGFDTTLAQVTSTRWTVTESTAARVRFSGVVEGFGLPVAAAYARDAHLLEACFGSVLTMRPDTAEAPKGETPDLIRTLSLKPPVPIERPAEAKQLVMTFRGLPDSLRLADDRQTERRQADGTRVITITRETRPETAPAEVPETWRAELADDPRYGLRDGTVQKVAARLAAGAKNRIEQVVRTREWVYHELAKRYSPVFSNAPDVLREKGGDCGEHAVLFVALMRAQGIPARELAGMMYAPSMGAFAYHAWAEVWLGRWVSVDPTFNQFPADATHLTLARGGVAEQTKIGAVIGAVTLEGIEVR